MTFEDNALGKRVLLVDDHQEAREARARRLGVHGVFVETVSTVQEARFCLRNDSYNLVLLAARENPKSAIALRREILDQNPKHRVAFLVGPPHFISLTLGENPPKIEPQSSDWSERLMGRLSRA
jgi:DNA-binding NtrC family response regulator